MFRRTFSALRLSLSRSDHDLIAAGVAYYAMFAMFPALAAGVALFSLMSDPSVISAEFDLLSDVIPGDIHALLADQIARLLTAGRQALGWATTLSFLVALWTARAGVGALIRALTLIAGAPPRTGLWQLVMAFALTFALMFVALLSLLGVVVVPIVLAFLPLPGWDVIIAVIRWGAMLFILLAALGILYRYGPNLEPDSRPGWLTPGALIAVVLWFAQSAALSQYLLHFSRYNEVYGALGALAGLMLWLYLSARIILLGAAINHALSHTRAARQTAELV